MTSPDRSLLLPTRPQALFAALLLIVCLTLAATGSPAQAGPSSRTTAGNLTLTPGAVAPGASVTATGSVPPKHSRTVKLQVKKAGKWRTLKTGHTNRRGKFRFTFTAPGSGKPTYRVLAPRTTIKNTVWPSVSTPSRRLTVIAVTSVAAGDTHACALTAGHDVWCWGQSNYGALGDGGVVGPTDTFSTGAVKVVGSGYLQVSAGDNTTCAVRTDGSLWCWGFNAKPNGEGDSSTPLQVPGVWKQVSAGGLTVCGIKEPDELWCWGQGMSGQLGDGQATNSYVPVQVDGSWSTVATGGEDYPAGGVTCAVDTDGKAWCWGENGQGRLGTGDNTDSNTPVAIDSTATWSSVSVGFTSTCGIQTDGSGWCWGTNVAGLLGDGTTTNQLSPHAVTIGGSTAWRQISIGQQHACGTQVDGNGWCWGWNDFGQTGNGSSDTSYYPIPIAPSHLPGSWSLLAAGRYSSVGATTQGSTFAWGDDSMGQLGDGGQGGEADAPRAVSLG